MSLKHPIEGLLEDEPNRSVVSLQRGRREYVNADVAS
jgi:hypothetical protein